MTLIVFDWAASHCQNSLNYHHLYWSSLQSLQQSKWVEEENPFGSFFFKNLFTFNCWPSGYLIVVNKWHFKRQQTWCGCLKFAILFSFLDGIKFRRRCSSPPHQTVVKHSGDQQQCNTCCEHTDLGRADIGGQRTESRQSAATPKRKFTETKRFKCTNKVVFWRFFAVAHKK